MDSLHVCIFGVLVFFQTLKTMKDRVVAKNRVFSFSIRAYSFQEPSYLRDDDPWRCIFTFQLLPFFRIICPACGIPPLWLLRTWKFLHPWPFNCHAFWVGKVDFWGPRDFFTLFPFHCFLGRQSVNHSFNLPVSSGSLGYCWRLSLSKANHLKYKSIIVRYKMRHLLVPNFSYAPLKSLL